VFSSEAGGDGAATSRYKRVALKSSTLQCTVLRGATSTLRGKRRTAAKWNYTAVSTLLSTDRFHHFVEAQ
jgi:hypothetical protein